MILHPKPQDWPDSCPNTDTKVDSRVALLVHTEPMSGLLVAHYFNLPPLGLSVPCPPLCPYLWISPVKWKEGTQPRSMSNSAPENHTQCSSGNPLLDLWGRTKACTEFPTHTASTAAPIWPVGNAGLCIRFQRGFFKSLLKDYKTKQNKKTKMCENCYIRRPLVMKWQLTPRSLSPES